MLENVNSFHLKLQNQDTLFYLIQQVVHFFLLLNHWTKNKSKIVVPAVSFSATISAVVAANYTQLFVILMKAEPCVQNF